MTIDRTQFDEKFAALRTRFCGRLLEYANQLEQHVSDCPASNASIADLIHRIAGTAGSFGFGSVSAAAAVLDERLVSGAEACACRTELGALVSLMRSAAE